MKLAFSLGISLFAVWLLWSGHYTLFLLALGVFSCALVTALALRMGIADPEGHPIHLLGHLLAYIPWLFWAIVRANIDIARIILNPRLPISPRLIQVKASQKTRLGQVIYANSITLTPGTVTLEVKGDSIKVHALTRSSAAGLESGAMNRRVTALEAQS